MSDILERIDRATGCQQCGGPLGDSPSDDFCGEPCQYRWHAAHVAAPALSWVEELDWQAALAEMRGVTTWHTAYCLDGCVNRALRFADRRMRDDWLQSHETTTGHRVRPGWEQHHRGSRR